VIGERVPRYVKFLQVRLCGLSKVALLIQGARFTSSEVYLFLVKRGVAADSVHPVAQEQQLT
jgi:hypothetical protein